MMNTPAKFALKQEIVQLENLALITLVLIALKTLNVEQDGNALKELALNAKAMLIANPVKTDLSVIWELEKEMTLLLETIDAMSVLIMDIALETKKLQTEN